MTPSSLRAAIKAACAGRLGDSTENLMNTPTDAQIDSLCDRAEACERWEREVKSLNGALLEVAGAVLDSDVSHANRLAKCGNIALDASAAFAANPAPGATG